MDAASALADLLEISAQVEAAVLVGGDGAVVASTLTSEAAAGRIARAGTSLLELATEQVAGGRAVTDAEVALREGSVFVAREGDRTIVARTPPRPSSQLVLYDLRATLRAAAPTKPKPKRRPAEKVRAKADA
jgi:predicted regulator of Ras-like GTPase activity (Roadblock/LC7/MglB family)